MRRLFRPIQTDSEGVFLLFYGAGAANLFLIVLHR